jgi:hypothetical protein
LLYNLAAAKRRTNTQHKLQWETDNNADSQIFKKGDPVPPWDEGNFCVLALTWTKFSLSCKAQWISSACPELPPPKKVQVMPNLKVVSSPPINKHGDNQSIRRHCDHRNHW